MEKLKQLQETRLELADKMKALAASQEKWTAEDRATWAKLNTDYDANLAELTAEKAKVDAEIAERHGVTARLADLDSWSDGLPENLGRGGDGSEADRRRELFQGRAAGNGFLANQALALQGWLMVAVGAVNRVRDEHRQAAAAIGANLGAGEFEIRLHSTGEFKRVRNDWRQQARNAMQVGQGSTGGFTVGETLVTTLERAMLDFSGVLQVCDVIRTPNGEPFKWPTIDDTGNTGTRVGEGQDAGSANDPSVGQVTWHAFDFTSGMLNVSRSLLADSAVVDLEEVIGQLLGERIGRKQNLDYTTGGGGGLAPRGIVTASALGVTAASATAIAYDEVIDLEHSIDPSRRNLPGVGYMAHDTIFQALRKLKDGEGRYLWQSGANSGMPDTLNARPLTANQNMASTMAAAAKTLLFGQMPAYKVRQVGSIRLQRLVELRAAFNEDAFIAYTRGDGNLLNAGDNPIKHLLHP